MKPGKDTGGDPGPRLQFPEYSFTIRRQATKAEIFDLIRKKYVALTPEEWVRQHAVRFLHEELGVPLGMMVLEKKLVLNRLGKRADILVYGLDRNARLLVECKAPEVRLNQKVFEQIARYNLVLRVPFLLVTNGIKHHCFEIDHGSNTILSLDHIPDWKEMNEKQIIESE